MICIYSTDNTNYSNNGDAVLIPISCTLTMTINGAWQLDLEHPYDAEERYKLIQEGAVIRADIKCVGEQSTIRQRFRIYTYNRGVNSVTCIAFPIAMEATFDAPIDNLVLENKTASEAVAQLQALTQKYSIETNVTGTKSTSFANTNINSALASGDDGCFIQVWGGEVVYDNLKFNIRSRIGSDTGYKIQYGHNMTGIDYSKDDSGLSTRVHPISEDGIRLNGTGYVDSPLIDNYPIHHDRYMITPYRLVDTEEASPSRTAQETRACVSAVTTATTTLSQSSYATALGAGYQPDYIKTINADIITAVQNMALANVISTDLYKLLSDTIKNAMAWLADLTQPEWGWMGSDQTGWRYGDTNGYAKDMYVRIGKTWSYFGSQGYWEEPKDDKEEWDWYQKEGEGRRYGNFNKYFAHNTFVYITMEGTLQEYWFNEEGWYEADESGESEWSWHGSGTSEDPYWFGEEGATSEDPKKYAHDTWLFIDGAYYFFDSYGYYAPNTAILDYQWDWVQDDERWWFGNAIDREFAAVYVESQWLKINGTWYYFDENGYVVDQDSSRSDAIAVFTTGMASLLTTVNTRKDALYTLLYALMTEWVNKKYSEGIDKPALTVTVSMADLSRTTEYANFAALETIKLGDSVEIDDTEHGIHTTGSRVIGLTYDVIRGYNSNVVIGKPQATVSSMLSQASGQAVAGGFDTSAIEAQIDALQDRVSDVRYNGRSLLQGTIAILDSIGGTSINYGTSTPTGGSDGDVYFQTDSNGNIVKIWQNHSGVWGYLSGGGSSSIPYGTTAPTGGSDGDVYFQVDLKEATDWVRFPPMPSRVTYNQWTWTYYDIVTDFGFEPSDYDKIRLKSLYPSTESSDINVSDITTTTMYVSSNELNGWNGLRRNPTTGKYEIFPNRGGEYYFEAKREEARIGEILAIWQNVRGTWINLTGGEEYEAGENITIEGDVISAVDTDEISELEDVALDNLSDGQVLKYNATTEKWENGNESGGGGGSGLILDAAIYSETEKQVGLWINNKPLYEITIDCGTAPNNTTKNYDLPTNNYEYIMIVDGCLYNPTTKASLPLNLIRTDNSNYENGCFLAMENNQIRVNDKADRSAFRVYVTIRYTKTTDSAGSGGYQAYGFSPIIYSDTEREVGVWRDNKPLYQKTFYIADLDYTSTRTNKNVGSISGIDMVVSLKGILSNGAKTQRYEISFPFASSGNLTTLYYNYTDNCIYFSSTTTWGDSDLYVTILYTKTTDVAGSGEYNTLAIPNVHYSTEEQVIGTWIDGKPIYQRTWTFNALSIPYNTWTDLTGISNSGMERIIEGKALGASAYFGYCSFTGDTGSYVRILQTRNTTIQIYAVTLQYTKTT